jgi:hypothetical protein
MTALMKKAEQTSSDPSIEPMIPAYCKCSTATIAQTSNLHLIPSIEASERQTTMLHTRENHRNDVKRPNWLNCSAAATLDAKSTAIRHGKPNDQRALHLTMRIRQTRHLDRIPTNQQIPPHLMTHQGRLYRRRTISIQT